MTENNNNINTVNFDDFTFTSDVSRMMEARSIIAKDLGCDVNTMPMMLGKSEVFALLESKGYDPRLIFLSPSHGGVCKWSVSKVLDKGMGIAPSGAGVAWFPQAYVAFLQRLEEHGECFKGTRKTRKSTGKRWSWSNTFEANQWGEYDSKGKTINIQLIIPHNIASKYAGNLKTDALNLLVDNINAQMLAAEKIATFLTHNN